MELAIAYDNRPADEGYLSGWGFACLVDGRVLFDTGEDYPPLRENIGLMKRDLSGLESVVLSHRHWDHTGGLEGLLRELDSEINVYGCSDTESSLKRMIESYGSNFMEADGLREVSSGIYSTGQIEGDYKNSSMLEQSLVVRAGEGLAVVTGCSHPGIVNIIERVGELFPGERILLVVGGFHLGAAGREEVFSIARKLREMGVEKVAPAHCTGEEAISIFEEVYGDDFISAGAGKVMEI